MTNSGKCVSHIVISGGNLELIGLGKEMYAGSDEEDSFKSFCDLKTFMKSFTESGGEKKTKGKPVQVAGQLTVPITNPDEGGTTTVYVTTEGEPYILKAPHTGSDAGSVIFSDFDKPLNAVAPPAAQTVDASKLGL